ncbi:MAG: sigma 54-interacting transcriptional regulator [Planctomycetaceae bacterium]
MPRRRKKTPGFEPLLGRTNLPVFAVDADRKVVAFNAGCESLTGWKAIDVLGATSHYGSATELSGIASLVSSLCPPPEAFAGQSLAAPAYLMSRDARAIPRLVRFFPLIDDQGRVSGVVGVAEPLPAPAALPEFAATHTLHARLAALRGELSSQFSTRSLVAASVAMRKVLVQVELAQQTSVPVLLCGESGTGREHLARLIHFGGPLKSRWFVPLDCRALGAEELDRMWQRLLEQHRSGGGTTGLAGTVYLADVEHFPREVQERLVREFSSGEPQDRVRLRLICSKECAPEGAAREERLRADFLALVSPLTITVPPLRERSDDLPLLAQHFLEELNREGPRQAAGFDDAIWPLFRRYAWPGNLDELLAIVREARERSTEPIIRVHDLPFRFRDALNAQSLPSPAAPPPVPLDALLARVESRLIDLALARAKQNRSQAAQILGVPRARLLRRIEQLGRSDDPSAQPSKSVVELTDELLKDDVSES